MTADTRYATHIKKAQEALSLYSQSENEKDLIIHGLEEGSEAWKSEYDNCRAILQELVDLKVLKDTYGSRVEGYENRKPIAWTQAKEFLKTYQHGYEYNSQSKEGEERKEEIADIAYAAFKRVYPEPTEGTFGSTWINGYCQCLRDFESQSKENEGKQAGVFVKASERMPEYNKLVNGKLNGRPALVKNSNLAKGYMTANGNLERIVFIEWLDESIQSGERGEVERLKGHLKEIVRLRSEATSTQELFPLLQYITKNLNDL